MLLPFLARGSAGARESL